MRQRASLKNNSNKHSSRFILHFHHLLSQIILTGLIILNKHCFSDTVGHKGHLKKLL